ncbi:hypothetical protein K438DRAFT_1768976 [Mycena galopus ATCC 62051]|nr:hypothetical protein K438DRAFT_1768976 [Mycena galopus ATCC 62051]
MSLFHATVPSLKHSTSEAFRRKIQDAGPSAEDPPSKRPRIAGKNPFERQVAAMSAYTSNVNLRALLWANNTVMINNLEQELQQSSCGWTLNDWDVPVCDEDAECSICDTHTRHFLGRLGRADDDSANDSFGGLSAEEEDRSASPGSDSESDEVQEKSLWMKKLLRLRDLRARERAYKSDEPDVLQGMMVALTFDQLRAEADRDAANSHWSLIDKEKDALHESLRTLTQTHDDLQTRHNATLDELEVLKRQISTMSAIPTTLPMATPAIAMIASASTLAISASPPLAASAVPPSPINAPAIPAFSHAEWLAMKMPPPSASPQLLACWLQFQEHTGLNGVRLCGPSWDVDLRDLRGYKEVMGRVPEMRKNSGVTERRNRQRCIFAILDVLALPGRYAELLRADKCAVATQVRYSPLSLQQGQQDLAVARLLAAQGLTVAVADDAWQYTYGYIKSIAVDQSVHKARSDAARKLLGNIEARLGDAPPVGLKSSEEDRFLRPSLLPNKRLSIFQEKREHAGLFIIFIYFIWNLRRFASLCEVAFGRTLRSLNSTAVGRLSPAHALWILDAAVAAEDRWSHLLFHVEACSCSVVNTSGYAMPPAFETGSSHLLDGHFDLMMQYFASRAVT